MLAGFFVALVTVTFCVANGLIAFHPLGSDYALFGIQAALWGGVATGLVSTLVGGTRAKATAPILAGSLILAASIEDLATDPRLPADPDERFVVSVGFAAIVVAVAGLLQVAFGAIRLGGLVKYLAYPVVAGLTGGVALLVLKSQIPVTLGWSAWSSWRLQPVSVPTVVMAGLVISAMLFSNRRFPAVPPQGVGLVVGVGLGVALSWFDPETVAKVQDLPKSWPTIVDPLAALHLLGDHRLSFTVEHVFMPALSIALFSSLNSLLASTAVDAMSGQVHDSDRELIGQGLGNVTSALVGGLPGGGGASLSTMNYRCGGRTRLAGVAAAVVLTAFIFSIGHLLDAIPRGVLAAIVMVGACRLVDPWVIRLARAALAPGRRGDRPIVLTNLALTIGVAALSLVANLIVAVVVGILASWAYFIARAASTPYRLAYRGDGVRSKRARPKEDLEALAVLGRSIAVFELQGPLFFGSAARLVSRIARDARDASHVIVGLGRVSEIDASGFRVAFQFITRMRREGRTVLISRLTVEHPLWRHLADMGVDTRDVGRQFFPDTDSALEWAEDDLLKEVRPGRVGRPELRLSEMDTLRGAPDAMIDWLEANLARQVHPPGSTIIREGDADRSLFFLVAGTVSVQAVVAGRGLVARIASFSPGTVFGEIAFLDAGLRSASATADEEVVCHILTLDTFERLRKERPDFAVTLLANLSLDLSRRLRATSTELRALQE